MKNYDKNDEKKVSKVTGGDYCKTSVKANIREAPGLKIPCTQKHVWLIIYMLYVLCTLAPMVFLLKIDVSVYLIAGMNTEKSVFKGHQIHTF